jgi:hypothetical protein
MKHKLFTTIVVLVSVSLAILWVREQAYRTRLRRIDAEVAAIKTRLRLLRLKTQALKAEVELLNLSTYIRLLKGWKPGNALTGRSPLPGPAKIYREKKPQKHRREKAPAFQTLISRR